MQKYVCFLMGLALAAGALGAPIVCVAPDGGLFYKDSAEKSIPAGSPSVLSTGGITFNIYYVDVINASGIGFDGTHGLQARARLEDTLTYIANVLHEAGTLDVVVNASQQDGTGALAFAGTYYPVAAGAFPGTALARLHDPGDAKPFSTTEEIQVTVDFGYAWNYSTSAASNFEVDLESVLLHEITHGLGFSSLANSTGASAITANCYTVYDLLLRRRTGNTALFSGNPPSFTGALADLTSQDLAWGGDEAIQAYLPNAAPGIYAPATFASGSSISHWDTNNIIGGAVMEHAINFGETRRTYAAIDLGALRDIGYLDANDAPPVDCTFSQCPDFTGEGAGLYTTLSTLLSQPLDYSNSDLDGAGIPDRFEIALLKHVLCDKGTVYSDNAPCVFNANVAALGQEASLFGMDTSVHTLAGLMTVSGTLQAALAGTGLTGSYTSLTATGAKTYEEILSAQGDPDQDGYNNLEEYQNVVADGGDEAEFVRAAFDPLVDGSAGSAANVPLAGLAGLGMLLGTLGTASAAALRKKRS